MSAPQPDPHAADDPRVRPQYGEYASAEEQRSRIQHPVPATVEPAAPVPQAAPALPAWGAPAPVAPRATAHPGDRIVTIALLAFGAVYVINSALSFLNLPAAAANAFRVIGVPGEFTNVDSARVWGVIATIVLVVGYVATLLLSVRTLRRGVRAWWIPLVGAAVTLIVVYICVAIPLIGDPALTHYITTVR